MGEKTIKPEEVLKNHYRFIRRKDGTLALVDKDFNILINDVENQPNLSDWIEQNKLWAKANNPWETAQLASIMGASRPKTESIISNIWNSKPVQAQRQILDWQGRMVSPSNYVGAVKDVYNGIPFKEVVNRFFNTSNAGIFTENFAREYPTLTFFGNLGADILTPGAIFKVGKLPEIVTKLYKSIPAATATGKLYVNPSGPVLDFLSNWISRYAQKGNLTAALRSIQNGSAGETEWKLLTESDEGQKFLKELWKEDPDNFNILMNDNLTNELRGKLGIPLETQTGQLVDDIIVFSDDGSRSIKFSKGTPIRESNGRKYVSNEHGTFKLNTEGTSLERGRQSGLSSQGLETLFPESSEKFNFTRTNSGFEFTPKSKYDTRVQWFWTRDPQQPNFIRRKLFGQKAPDNTTYAFINNEDRFQLKNLPTKVKDTWLVPADRTFSPIKAFVSLGAATRLIGGKNFWDKNIQPGVKWFMNYQFGTNNDSIQNNKLKTSYEWGPKVELKDIGISVDTVHRQDGLYGIIESTDSTNTYEAYKIKKNRDGSYELENRTPIPVQKTKVGYDFLDDINKREINNQNNQKSTQEPKEKPKDQPTLNPQDTVPTIQNQNNWNNEIGMIPKWYERRFA